MNRTSAIEVRSTTNFLCYDQVLLCFDVWCRMLQSVCFDIDVKIGTFLCCWVSMLMFCWVGVLVMCWCGATHELTVCLFCSIVTRAVKSHLHPSPEKSSPMRSKSRVEFRYVVKKSPPDAQPSQPSNFHQPAPLNELRPLSKSSQPSESLQKPSPPSVQIPHQFAAHQPHQSRQPASIAMIENLLVEIQEMHAKNTELSVKLADLSSPQTFQERIEKIIETVNSSKPREQDHLFDCRQSLLEIRKRSESHIRKVNCQVCRIRPRSRAFTPCGHCFCEECIATKVTKDRRGRLLCLVCQQPSDRLQSMFF